MKINPKINKRVNDAVDNCRQVLVESTIELLKSIGVESNVSMSFNKTIILFQHKESATTETIVFNKIWWGEGSRNYYMLLMGDEYLRTDLFLSLSSLQIVYNEVKRVARNYNP